MVPQRVILILTRRLEVFELGSFGVSEKGKEWFSVHTEQKKSEGR